MRKKKSKFLKIHLGIYRVGVLITWETTAKEIEDHIKDLGLDIAKSFQDDFNEATKDAVGLCIKPSNDYPDLVVWLAKGPKKASEYGTLYHELYHAVDSIAESRSLEDETESRAYIFEYLATEANRFFWP